MNMFCHELRLESDLMTSGCEAEEMKMFLKTDGVSRNTSLIDDQGRRIPAESISFELDTAKGEIAEIVIRLLPLSLCIDAELPVMKSLFEVADQQMAKNPWRKELQELKNKNRILQIKLKRAERRNDETASQKISPKTLDK